MKQIMTSIKGVSLDNTEKEILSHPLIYGVILFSRNYQNKAQLHELTTEIKAINPYLKIAVDHEGGRVWRFKEGFSTIPAMQTLENIYHQERERAQELAYTYGKTIATELLEAGVDFSFTPVLDINYNNSSIIGNRSFSKDKNIIISLAKKLICGLHDAHSISVGKHYPGHGFATADSHLELPVDTRTFAEMSDDLFVFKALASQLDAVMTAHILYPQFDDVPATFSKKWLDYLRSEIGFKGIIFSDDLSMLGAKIIPNIQQRVRASFTAGCDVALICNDEAATLQALKENYE